MVESTILQYDVAVIGSGPAGLAAATAMKRLGISRVVVLERDATPGGIPRHCFHPPFGMLEYHRIMTGPAYTRRNVAEALNAGVDIRLQHSVVSLGPNGRLDVATPTGPIYIAAQRILLATGARELPRSARLISGDRPLGVINTGALQSYLHIERLKPFLRPLIVGSELVAMSAVLSCLRAGIRPVAVIEPSNRPIARWPLHLFPLLCGIPMQLETDIEAVEGSPRVNSALLRSGDGSHQRIDCDGVLLTGRFVPESTLVRTSHLLLDEYSGGPIIDQFGRCSDPIYFAAGNLLRPIETAGWSFREGHRIAALIKDDLNGLLPCSDQGVTIKCLSPLKFCVPQHLLVGRKIGLRQLQLRTALPMYGELRIRFNGQVLWRSRGRFMPERRILVPLSEINIHDNKGQITIDLIK